jgi:hypothetical protein
MNAVFFFSFPGSGPEDLYTIETETIAFSTYTVQGSVARQEIAPFTLLCLGARGTAAN